VELPDKAARALETVRRTGRIVRFEVRKGCEQERWRLKVIYLAVDARTGATSEVQLGLLWSEDRRAIQELRDRLAAQG